MNLKCDKSPAYDCYIVKLVEYEDVHHIYLWLTMIYITFQKVEKLYDIEVFGVLM